MAPGYLEVDSDTLHVFDLPQLYTRPSAEALLEVLSLLTSAPPSWEGSDTEDAVEALELMAAAPQRRKDRKVKVAPEGLTRYLTSIISSSLKWIENDSLKEEIWEQASLRLSERSGRSAMGAISRIFQIPTSQQSFSIELHEPALTGDQLGFKTWASSYLLSKRLHTISLPVTTDQAPLRILELGSGTGLVGLAAAAVFQAQTYLTDLPEITTNLQRNAEANRAVVEAYGGSVVTAVLDWTQPDRMHLTSTSSTTDDPVEKFPVIVAADSLYSAEHPRLLVQTIERWLLRTNDARVLVEFPLRDGYSAEREDFKQRMIGIGLDVLEHGEETGYDDWGWSGGDDRQESQRVRCWWSTWGWKNR